METLIHLNFENHEYAPGKVFLKPEYLIYGNLGSHQSVVM